MSAVLRPEAIDETQGFMKILVGEDGDRWARDWGFMS
jgi:hypothetical protein